VKTNEKGREETKRIAAATEQQQLQCCQAGALGFPKKKKAGALVCLFPDPEEI